MQSLQYQLAALIDTGIILWVNHPDMKTFNGKLIEVHSDHIAMLISEVTYWIPYGAITAIRRI
jgi:hypothetical protein